MLYLHGRLLGGDETFCKKFTKNENFEGKMNYPFKNMLYI